MKNPRIAQDGLAQQVAEALSYLSAAYQKWCEECAQQDDLSYSRLWLLGILWMEGPMKMSELGSSLGVTGRTVTALVDGLEREGLVERQDVPGDRRVNLIVLTPGAKKSTGKRLAELLSKMSSAFTGMSDDELQAALTLIAKFQSAIDTARARGPVKEI